MPNFREIFTFPPKITEWTPAVVKNVKEQHARVNKTLTAMVNAATFGFLAIAAYSAYRLYQEGFRWSLTVAPAASFALLSILAIYFEALIKSNTPAARGYKEPEALKSPSRGAHPASKTTSPVPIRPTDSPARTTLTSSVADLRGRGSDDGSGVWAAVRGRQLSEEASEEVSEDIREGTGAGEAPLIDFGSAVFSGTEAGTADTGMEFISSKPALTTPPATPSKGPMDGASSAGNSSLKESPGEWLVEEEIGTPSAGDITASFRSRPSSRLLGNL